MDSTFTQILLSFPYYEHADLFPRNWLAPIPNFNKENNLMWPTSPSYNPEQVIRDHEAHHPLPTPPSPPPPTSVSETLIGNSSAIPIVVNTPSPQPLAVPVKEEDWHDRAYASEAV